MEKYYIIYVSNCSVLEQIFKTKKESEDFISAFLIENEGLESDYYIYCVFYGYKMQVEPTHKLMIGDE